MIDMPKVAKPKVPSYRDLIQTNCPRRFQNSYAVDTSLLDFHKIVVIVKKKNYKKNLPI